MSRKALVLNPDGRAAQSSNPFLETTDPITKIQSAPVASGTPASGVFLRYNGSTWQYVTIADINALNEVIVDNLKGIPITNLSPNNGEILKYDAGTNTWITATDTLSFRYVGGSTLYDAEIVEVSGILISNPSTGVVRLTAVGGSGGGGSISFREVDNNPTMTTVTQVVVSNGDLQDLGGGVARLRTAGDASAPIGSILYMYERFY